MADLAEPGDESDHGDEVLPVVGEDRHERARVSRSVVGRVELRDHRRRQVVGPLVAEHAGLDGAEPAVREPVPPEADGTMGRRSRW